MNDRVGKLIPNALLFRDKKWRSQVIEHQNKHFKAFKAQPQVPPECPICSGHATNAGKVRGIGFFECESCEHLFCSIFPSDSFLKMYYEQEESAQLFTYLDSNDSTSSDRVSLLALPKAQFIHESGKNRDQKEDRSGAWVDIGGGIGDLLVAAQQLGYEAIAIEPDPLQSEIARSRGIAVIEDFFTHESENIETLKRAEVVSLINVLEHIPAPRNLLDNLVSQMRRGAVLAVEVPRHPSLSSIFQLAGIVDTNRHINPPEHLHVFSDLSMVKLFESVGLRMEHRWIFGSDALEVFSSVGFHLGWEAGFDSSGLPDTINLLQSSVDQRGLSDNMLVIGRKE